MSLFELEKLKIHVRGLWQKRASFNHPRPINGELYIVLTMARIITLEIIRWVLSVVSYSKNNKKKFGNRICSYVQGKGWESSH
jgi:hypothetical protein